MEPIAESLREKRNSVIVRALVTVSGRAPTERRVRNLSRSGACVEHDGELTIGSIVRLEMGTLHDLGAEVVWVTERLAGLRFVMAIDLDEARKPRGLTIKAKIGWMADINDAYRR